MTDAEKVTEVEAWWRKEAGRAYRTPPERRAIQDVLFLAGTLREAWEQLKECDAHVQELEADLDAEHGIVPAQEADDAK